MKIVVYTAIAGGYDQLKSQPFVDAEMVALLDDPEVPAVLPWNIKPIAKRQKTARLTAKWYKVMAHEALPDADYSLWIDGSVLMRPGFSVRALIEKSLGDADIALFKHSRRNCIYDEAWECIRLNLDSPDLIYKQVCAYTRRNYPQNAGLNECGIILRRHTPAIAKLNTAWWNEIQRFSIRDQISFNVMAAATGTRINALPGSMHRNDFFRMFVHRISREDQIQSAADWESCLLAGIEFQSRGDLHAAMLEFLRSIAIRSDFVDTWLCLGAVLKQLKAFADAVRALGKALEIEPQNNEALRLLSSTLWEGGEIEKALQIALIYLKAFPEDSWGYVQSGEILLELGRLDEAVSRFTEEVTRNARSSRAYLGLSKVEFSRQSYERALEFLDKAQSLEPDFPLYSYWRGRICEATGKTGPAADNFREFLAKAAGEILTGPLPDDVRRRLDALS